MDERSRRRDLVDPTHVPAPDVTLVWAQPWVEGRHCAGGTEGVSLCAGYEQRCSYGVLQLDALRWMAAMARLRIGMAASAMTLGLLGGPALVEAGTVASAATRARDLWLIVRVVNATTGEPLEGVAVSIAAESADRSWSPARRSRTDEFGEYSTRIDRRTRALHILATCSLGSPSFSGSRALALPANPGDPLEIEVLVDAPFGVLRCVATRRRTIPRIEYPDWPLPPLPGTRCDPFPCAPARVRLVPRS